MVYTIYPGGLGNYITSLILVLTIPVRFCGKDLVGPIIGVMICGIIVSIIMINISVDLGKYVDVMREILNDETNAARYNSCAD